ncbi:MAG TPA: membrane protein insertion efficiency factor YidD [Gaiellaceae bacterium]|nr:membrane protein insertion efficiency factor YidD [Gaiellaceae bacterium]
MRYLGIGLVWIYRLTFGALFPTTCKYHPSCSEYAVQALRRYGLVRGSILAGWRLLRCNPWSRGGVDHVPERGGTPGSPTSPLLAGGLGWRRLPKPPRRGEPREVLVVGEPLAGPSPASAADRLDLRARAKARA